MQNFRAIILAAGKGTRMKSDTPKVLHKVCGKAILDYVLGITEALRSLKTYVVIGHGAGLVAKTIGARAEFVVQDQLLGTADAVNRCASQLKNYNGTVLVLCGDTPLLSKEIVQSLLKKHASQKSSATFLTAKIDDPSGYGRIVRNASGDVLAIREQKDATPQEDKINEINVGVYCFQAKELFDSLKKVKLNPKKKEFYLTDVIELLLSSGKRVATLVTQDASVSLGVNDREDLSLAEAIIRKRILVEHMRNGVTIVDPATTYIEADVKIGRDTIIYPMSVIHQDVHIGMHCSIGPLARLRPGTRIANRAEIGNFTEISRSKIGQAVMMKHFSFLGDATVGDQVNIGAGTVTANYDGRLKNPTTIGAGAFIGSDSVLIAPLRIGSKAIIGAGSVVTKGKNIPASAIAFGVPAKVMKG